MMLVVLIDFIFFSFFFFIEVVMIYNVKFCCTTK